MDLEVPEPTADLLQAARVEAWKRIQLDLERLSREPRAVATLIADRLREPGVETLFPPGFDAREVKRSLSPSAETLARFRSELGVGLRGYFSRCKIEAAKGLLRYRDLKVWRIASFVGYSGLQPFWRAFKTATGASPSQFRQRSTPRVRQRVPATELNSEAFWWQATAGALLPEDHQALLARLRARGLESSGVPATTVTLTSRGTEHEASVARWLWLRLEPLPAAERRRWVRRVRLDSPAFFHLLVEKIRQRVRKDPRACLELAELALAHLEASEPTLGDQVPNLRALAWAWLANARRLLEDFAAAEQSFARAWQDWKDAGRDPRVEAEICWLEANFRMYQRRTDEALDLLARSTALAEALGYSRVLISSLLSRVAIVGAAGDAEATIPDLWRALRAAKGLQEPALELVAYCDLATSYALAGRPREALEVLPAAEALCEELDEPVTRCQLQWTEGLAKQALGDHGAARELLQQARRGFTEFGARGYAAVVSLDLAALCLDQGWLRDVPRLAAEAIPVFESLRLDREALATLELLRSAVVKNEVSLPVLKAARACLAGSL